MITVIGGVLADCSPEASRMDACESKGVSHDACYAAEQNRQAMVDATVGRQIMESA